MKSYKKLEVKYNTEELAESFIFPNDDKKAKESSLELFRQYRRKADLKRTPQDKLVSQLLQLRFLMEDYLKTKTLDTKYNFGYFLEEYITILDKKKKVFAEEIDIDPTELSQIINRHRLPNEKIMIRLELHSNSNFPAW